MKTPDPYYAEWFRAICSEAGIGEDTTEYLLMAFRDEGFVIVKEEATA